MFQKSSTLLPLLYHDLVTRVFRGGNAHIAGQCINRPLSMLDRLLLALKLVY